MTMTTNGLAKTTPTKRASLAELRRRLDDARRAYYAKCRARVWCVEESRAVLDAAIALTDAEERAR